MSTICIGREKRLRSRDDLPDPIADGADPYVPTNRPAIGDLRSLFQF
jgi:phospholipase C